MIRLNPNHDTPTPYSVELIFDMPHTLLRLRNYRVNLQYDVGYSTVADLQDSSSILDKNSVWWNYRGTLELDNPKYKYFEGNLKNQIFISKEQYERLQRVFMIGFFQNEKPHELMYGIFTGKVCVSWSIASLAYADIIPSDKDYQNIIFDNKSINALNFKLGVASFGELITSLFRDYGKAGIYRILGALTNGDESLYYKCMSAISDPSKKEIVPVVIGECVEQLKNNNNYSVKFATLDDFNGVGRDIFEQAYDEAEKLNIPYVKKRHEAQTIIEEKLRYQKLLEIEDDLEYDARIKEGRYQLLEVNGTHRYVDLLTNQIVFDNKSADRLLELGEFRHLETNKKESVFNENIYGVK